MIDARKEALKEGLRQLKPAHIERLISHIKEGKPLLLDRDEEGNANYSNGTLCPLAVAIEVEDFLYVFDKPMNNENVAWFLEDVCKFKIYNTRGISGEFYTTNRREDLLLAAEEVLQEK